MPKRKKFLGRQCLYRFVCYVFLHLFMRLLVKRYLVKQFYICQPNLKSNMKIKHFLCHMLYCFTGQDRFFSIEIREPYEIVSYIIGYDLYYFFLTEILFILLFPLAYITNSLILHFNINIVKIVTLLISCFSVRPSKTIDKVYFKKLVDGDSDDQNHSHFRWYLISYSLKIVTSILFYYLLIFI